MQGFYCANITITLVANSASVSYGGTTYSLPATDESVSSQVCFWKVANRAVANVTFDSCRPIVYVNYTGVTPMPIKTTTPLDGEITLFDVRWKGGGEGLLPYSNGSVLEGVSVNCC